MAVQKLVFASKSERQNYYKVRRQWGKDYNLYPNLPFLMVFNSKDVYDLDRLNNWEMKKIELTPVEWSRLKKTSIDYTLCDKEDTPLVCIEFDGMQEGFNLGTKYHTDVPSDEWRQLITELKLKVAHGSGFPFFVVGSRHFKDLSDDIKLTIVDGIIGEVLSKRAAHDRFAEGFKPEDAGYGQEDFDSLHEVQQREIIQDWVLCVEVEADCTHNPIVIKNGQLQQELGSYGHSTKFLEYPPAPGTENMAARIKALENATMNGVECVVKTPDFGEVKRTCWLPNFKTPYFTGLGLMEEVAQLMALDWIKRQRELKTLSNPVAS